MRDSLTACVLLCLSVVACEKEKPAAAPTAPAATEATSTATEAAPATAPASATTAALQKCSCTAAPTESCHPNCPPITWESADCDSSAGRPKACKEPAKH